MQPKINILLINDPEKKESNSVLDNIRKVQQFTEVNSLTYAREAIKKQRLDVVILDIELDDENKLRFMKWIKQTYPSVILILYSSYFEIFSPIYQKIFCAHFFIDPSTEIEEIKSMFKENIKQSKKTTLRENISGSVAR